MGMVFVAGIGVAVFIEFLLISKKNKSASDNILTAWMFLILVQLFLFSLYFTGEIYRYPFFLGTESPLPLINGALLYLYVGSLTGLLPRKKWILVLHAVPVTTLYLSLIPFFNLPAEQKIQVYLNRGAGYETFEDVKRVMIICSGIFYVTWSALLLRKHRKNIRDQFSDVEKINLQWLRMLTLSLGGIWCIVIVFRNDLLIYLGVVVFVFLIGIFGIRQRSIFAHGEPDIEAPDQKEKYKKSGLTDEVSHALHQRLMRLMQEKALYKKSDVSIGDLAEALSLHPNYLSQIINEREGKNFYDFVNTFRIEEFKRLVAMPQNRHLTLLSVAFDCGFNSKSSFNRFFKRATGQTPSQYFDALPRQPSSSETIS